MANTTVSRADLSEAIHRGVGLSRNESAQMLETILSKTSDVLIRGQTVKVSTFGTFAEREKDARVGRHPKISKTVPIDPRRVLAFRPSGIMKDRVNDGRAR